MPTFFSASLLSIVVVASIAAVGWVRRRATQLDDDNHKKKDSDDKGIEIVVDSDTQCLLVSSKQGDTQSSITNKLAVELVNRRQYVKAVCDRFESWASSPTADSNEDGCAVIKPVAISGQDAALSSNATSAFRTKPKPNNLSSFVRQCVSNIERTACGAVLPSSHTASPRHSTVSNQCESPPKASAMEARQMPNLVTETDCDPKQTQPEEDDPEASFRRPVLRRTPSDYASSITRAASVAPLIVPFAASAMKSIASQSLPPVWSRGSKPDASTKGAYLDPEELESPALPDESDDGAVPMAPPPRKTSSAAARLLQFQQLVPSNQARSSFAAH